MPAAMEKALKKEAKKKFPRNKKRQNAYTYGAMRKAGWSPGKRSR